MNREQVAEYLKTIPDNEPLFLLRAQDCLASETVEKWALSARAMGVDNHKTRGAFDTSEEMLTWHTRKIPD